MRTSDGASPGAIRVDHPSPGEDPPRSEVQKSAGTTGDIRPIVYLDVDDVLIRWEGRYCEAAPHAADFLRWLLCHCEVRWITSWCPDGEMREDRLRLLSEFLGMDPEELQQICNHKSFPGKAHGYPIKHVAIDFDDGRDWVWIEDENLAKANLDELTRRGVADRYIRCNTSWDPEDLIRVMDVLAQRFGLSTRP